MLRDDIQMKLSLSPYQGLYGIIISEDLLRKIKDNIDFSFVNPKFPDKPSETAELVDEIEYTYKLLKAVREDILQSEKGTLIKLYERIKELLDTDRIREIRSKVDEDARFGHKSILVCTLTRS